METSVGGRWSEEDGVCRAASVGRRLQDAPLPGFPTEEEAELPGTGSGRCFSGLDKIQFRPFFIWSELIVT